MDNQSTEAINNMYNITDDQRDTALKERANKASKMIWVTFRKEGIHKYPAAIDDPKLATGKWDDVSF